jgi:hypothetical protein
LGARRIVSRVGIGRWYDRAEGTAALDPPDRSSDR